MITRRGGPPSAGIDVEARPASARRASAASTRGLASGVRMGASFDQLASDGMNGERAGQRLDRRQRRLRRRAGSGVGRMAARRIVGARRPAPRGRRPRLSRAVRQQPGRQLHRNRSGFARETTPARSGACPASTPLSTRARPPRADRVQQVRQRLRRARSARPRRSRAGGTAARSSTSPSAAGARLVRRASPSSGSGPAALHHRRRVAGSAGGAVRRRATSPKARWTSASASSSPPASASTTSGASALAGVADPFSPRPAFAGRHGRVGEPEGRPRRGRAPGRRRGIHEDCARAVGTGIRPPDAFEIAFTDNPGLQARAQHAASRPASRRPSPAARASPKPPVSPIATTT